VKTTSPILSLTKRVAVKAACALLVATFAGSVMAADAPLKIAVVDMAGALFNSERAKVVNDQLETETAGDKAKLQTLGEQAQALQQKMEQDASVMSDEEKRKSTEEIQEISVQYQFLMERLQTLLNERRETFQNTHAQSLIQAIQSVIEEGQYDLVIRAEAALYFGTEHDITARVTEKLNSQP
jgi:outer membrane protein